MDIKVLERSNIYIPEFNGNKELPDSEQVSVFIKKFPSVSDSSVYKSFEFSSNGSGISLNYKDALMITSCVGRIKNLSIGGKPIKDGRELAESECQALAGLISEIRNYLLDDGGVLEEGESKS